MRKKSFYKDRFRNLISCLSELLYLVVRALGRIAYAFRKKPQTSALAHRLAIFASKEQVGANQKSQI